MIIYLEDAKLILETNEVESAYVREDKMVINFKSTVRLDVDEYLESEFEELRMAMLDVRAVI